MRPTAMATGTDRRLSETLGLCPLERRLDPGGHSTARTERRSPGSEPSRIDPGSTHHGADTLRLLVELCIRLIAGFALSVQR